MTSPISKIPYPSNSDPHHMTNSSRPIVNALDRLCVPRFDNTTFRDAAIPSPSLGQMCYVETFDELYIYKENGWVSSCPRVVFKTADQLRTSSTTLVEDNHLKLLVEANSQYQGELVIMYNGDAAGDIKISMTGPAFCTVRCTQFMGLDTDSVSVSNHVKTDARTDFAASAIAFGAISTGNSVAARFKITVVTQATSGTLKTLIAQNTSNAIATTVQTGSSLELWKVK